MMHKDKRKIFFYSVLYSEYSKESYDCFLKSYSFVIKIKKDYINVEKKLN